MECHFDRLNWFVVSKDVPKTCMCILRFLREHEHTCDFENMVVSIDCTSAHFSAHVSYSFNLLLDLSSSLLVLLWLLFQFCLV